jgi:spore germination protein KB
LREFTDILNIFTFHVTPVGILNMYAVVAITIIVYFGLETIARFSSLIAKGALIIFVILLLLSAKNYHLSHLFPFFGYGIDQTLITGLKRANAYSEILILAVIAGSLQGANHIKRAGYYSLVISGLLISVSLFCYTLTFEYTTNQELVAPFYVMIRLINYGAFIQRMDPLFMFLWAVTTLITLSIMFYCAVSVFCKMNRVQDTRPIILPMAVLILSIAIFPKDSPSVSEIYVPALRDLGLYILLFLPSIALITSILRKKKGA